MNATMQMNLALSSQASRQIRPRLLGVHQWPVLEIGVTQEEYKNIERAWSLCSNGTRHISGEWVDRHEDALQEILGFDWREEFVKHFPDRMPAWTAKVMEAA